MDYVLPTDNVVDFVAGLSGSIVGTFLSLRGLVVLLVSLFIGAFRRSVLWTLPIAAAMPIVLLYKLLPVWSSQGVSANTQIFESTYIALSYATVSLLGYAVGRILRSRKHGST
jgi:hypothetical protein